jgi:hypothetical protein
MEFPVNVYIKLNENKENTTFVGVGVVNSFVTYVAYEKYYTCDVARVVITNLLQESESKKIRYNRMYLSSTLGRAFRWSDTNFNLFGAITFCFAPIVQERNTEFTFTNYKIGIEFGVSYSFCR